jgi:PhzF family phenazine biosynthesis protein
MKLFQVDAFADRPYSGNPAGVCILSEQRPESWMQDIALEMNLSETAFLLKSDNVYHLRWFTPKQEVGLCGHATLASAHILWEEKLINTDEKAVFHTRGGFLTAVKKDDSIEIGLPAKYTTPAALPGALKGAFLQEPVSVGIDDFIFLLEFNTDDVIRDMEPGIFRAGTLNSGAYIVTCRSSLKKYDFISRFFAPSLGIEEDPVTGLAHCYLAPFWAKRLNKNEFIGYQASARGGTVGCRLEDTRVFLKGRAVTVFELKLKQ